MLHKTLVLKVEVDKATEDVVSQFAKATAKWMQKVFGAWYADFRAHRADLSKSTFAGLTYRKRVSARAVGRRGSREKFLINVQGKRPNLYSLFVTKKSRVGPAPPPGIQQAHLLGPLSHLGTTMGNFLDRELALKRCRERRIRRRRKEARARRFGKEPDEWTPGDFYPRFKRIARFQHGLIRWEWEGGKPTAFSVTHPFERRGERLRIQLAHSEDPRYGDLLTLLAGSLKNGRMLAVELKEHDGRERKAGWYAHISIPVPEVPVSSNPQRVMGVDVGERNPAALVVLKGPNPDKDRIGSYPIYQGVSTRDALERQVNRVRRLRSAADFGSAGARQALQQARGKQARILNTLAHQVSHDVIVKAVAGKVDAIAMENLSEFVPGEKKRQKKMPFQGKRAKGLRRRLSRWNRGKVQHAIAYKAEAAGIRLAGPQGAGIYARGTSSTCPRCGKFDPQARDRLKHRFKCRQFGCGYSDNDDIAGAANIAARGWTWFHPPKGRMSTSSHPPGSDPGGSSNPPPKPGRASMGVDLAGTSVLAGGESSMPQATKRGLAGPSSHKPENAENGMGPAVVSTETNRPSTTAGGQSGNVEPATKHSDNGSTFHKGVPSERLGGETLSQTRSQAHFSAETRTMTSQRGSGSVLKMGRLSKMGNPSAGESRLPSQCVDADSAYGGNRAANPSAPLSVSQCVDADSAYGGPAAPMRESRTPGHNAWTPTQRMEARQGRIGRGDARVTMRGRRLSVWRRLPPSG